MIFKRPSLLTKLEIWFPRYHDLYENGERVALLACYKVDHGTPWILVEFSKAKHLLGQRFCAQRKEVQKCKIDTNGKIPCYVVPMSMFENWDSVEEVKEIIRSFGWI